MCKKTITIAVAVSFLCSAAFADCLLYESESYAVEGADAYRESCEEYGGGGSSFSSTVTESSPNNTCEGVYVDNAYVLRVSCNTCGSQTMKEELAANKQYCNDLCRTATLSCMTPLNSWGSILSGDATSCGNDDSSLPGCSKSSSSSAFSSSSQAESSDSDEESSSSEDGECDEEDPSACSSASEESSSSEALCPCTDEDGPCFDDDGICSENMSSSSSGKVSSSSMNGRYNLVNSYDGLCNKREDFSGAYGFFYVSYGTGKHYTRKPGFVGPKKFLFSCVENEITIATNIPQVFSNLDLHIECYDSATEEWTYLEFPDIPVTYTCPDVEKSIIDGCPTSGSVWSDGENRVINLYATLYGTYYASSVSDVRLETTGDDYDWKETYDYWGYDFDSSYFDRFPSNYSRMDLLNEPEFVSFFNECKRSTKTKLDFYSTIKEQIGDSVVQGEKPWDLHNPYVSGGGWVDLSDEYYQSLGISSYEDLCRFYEGENAVFYQSDDSLIYEEYYDEESFQIRKKYGILFYCAPAKSSSSSEEGESSSSEESSSSDESSSSEGLSSSEMESSSSSEMKESSSSDVLSSSSDEFVPGEDQVYTPDQIFRSGLQNMEPGACYSLNPDRGTIYGWNISYDASDTWWWQKVDCETGEKAVGNGIGACSAYPESVPSNVSGCYSYNGSCYICDKSKGDYVDCNADWLWKYNFPYHDWFKQVDCYDPYEEENEIIAEGCLDESLLRKVSMQEHVANDDVKTLSYSVDFTQFSQKYDALGRHRINKLPSHIALYQRNMSMPQPEVETSVVLQLPSISSADYCDRDSLGKWTCNINKKMLKKRVWSVDEFSDLERCDIKKGRDYWYYTRDTDPTTGKVVSKTYVGGVTCAWPKVDIIPLISQKNELLRSDGKIVGAKATVEYRFYTHTTLGENNHIIMKMGDSFSDGHVVTLDDENTYEKHELGHEFYNECVSYDEVEETGLFECSVKVSEKMSEDERTKILNDAVLADLTIKRKLF